MEDLFSCHEDLRLLVRPARVAHATYRLIHVLRVRSVFTHAGRPDTHTDANPCNRKSRLMWFRLKISFSKQSPAIPAELTLTA